MSDSFFTKNTAPGDQVFSDMIHAGCSKTMEFESKIYPYIGGYGRYNRLVVVFSWFPNFAVALNLFCDIFFTLAPESYHCQADPHLLPEDFPIRNISTQAFIRFTVPWLNGSGLSHCELYKYPRNWTNSSELERRELVPCTRGWMYGEAAGLQNNFVTEVRLFLIRIFLKYLFLKLLTIVLRNFSVCCQS